MVRTKTTAASASSSSSAAAAAAAASHTGPMSLEQHLRALESVAAEAGRVREEVAGLSREEATARILGAFGQVEDACAYMRRLATAEARAADPELEVRMRDTAARRQALLAPVGELAVALAVARAVRQGERKKRLDKAILEDVHRALDAAADEVEGAAEAAQEMKQQVLAPAESPRAALAALKEEVAIGDEEGWTASGYRPFEALALLEEMAAWLRDALRHCGLRDSIHQLQAKAAPLRQARPDDYPKMYRHAKSVSTMARALSEEGRIASKEYKTIHAALLFADLKYQSHLLPEKTLKDLLTQLTRPVTADDDEEEEENYDKPSRRGKGKEKETQEGLVKYLPLAQKEAVQALLEAAASGGKRGGKRGPAGKGKGKQAAVKDVALKPLCPDILGYAPPSLEGEKQGGKRPAENPFKAVLEVVDGVTKRLNRECKGGGLKRKAGGGDGGEGEAPYTIKRPKAEGSAQRQRRRWDVPECKRLLRGVVKFWQAGVRWRRIKEWDGKKGDQALLTHRTNLDLCEKARSLIEKWEAEERKDVDRDAFPMWAQQLMQDDARLARYCGRAAAAAAAEEEEEE